jgi:prepilin-type N-terminal cleavage/methylation domain-containing protein
MSRIATAGQRCGFTLIEALVVLGALAVLVSIAVPAVMAARESSRRAECLDHERSIGIAMHNSHSSRGCFVELHATMPCTGQRCLSAFAEWLPFLGRQDLFDAIPPCVWVTDFGLPDGEPRLPILICPSDAYEGKLNYRLCVGDRIGMTPNVDGQDAPNGAFPPGLGSVRLSDIQDGLSNTVGLSEKLGGPVDAEFDRRRSLWETGTPWLDRGSLADLCRSPPTNPWRYQTAGGVSWSDPTSYSCCYNHVAPPNWEGADCRLAVANYGLVHANSAHVRGVNCLFMDGRVQFIASDIDLTVWRAISTRSGGETTIPPP